MHEIRLFSFKDNMNKTITSIVLACFSGLAAHAQLNGNGYYRIQNVVTERYMSLSDNHSQGVDITSTTVDAGALVTRRDVDVVTIDPGTVFYIRNVSDNEYNISAQGANLHDMISYYVKLTALNDGSYRAWQIDHSQPIFLSDRNNYPEDEQSYVDTKTSTTQRWYIKPVNTTDNYIGVKPKFEHNGKYYTTFFADFAFSFASTGMRALYINKIQGNGTATYKYIEGTVPAETPVIIECSSESPADNILQIETTSPAAITDNLLTGVFFGMGVRSSDHFNCTPFDASIMRVLGLTEDGSLAINNAETYMADIMTKVGSNYDYTYPVVKAIPHNTAYVKVDATTPAELKLFEDGDPAGIVDINGNSDISAGTIYNLNGMVVRKSATSTAGLPSGIYVFKGKKVVVK